MIFSVIEVKSLPTSFNFVWQCNKMHKVFHVRFKKKVDPELFFIINN